MQDLPRRNLLGRPVALSDAAGLRARRDVAIESIIEPQSDGVEASLVRLPPDATFAPPVHAHAADRFYLVGEGVMVVCGERLPRFATAFVSAGEDNLELVAGEAGLEVLALQFPARTDPH